MITSLFSTQGDHYENHSFKKRVLQEKLISNLKGKARRWESMFMEMSFSLFKIKDVKELIIESNL